MDTIAHKDRPLLTPDQFDWFSQRHDIIWLAAHWAMEGDPTSLKALGDYCRTSPDWRVLFGEMTWDDAYIRYRRMLIGKN
jgi:hypothetical protein